MLLKYNFQFTNLTYFFVFLYCVVMAWGGEYSYANNPLFNYLKDVLDLQRNYYDRLGHFLEGFVPALIAREVIIRKNLVNGSGWTDFFTICVCLAAAAIYEFFEWGVAMATSSAADAFLGTQGDVWDTQWDMFMALLGSLAAVFLAAPYQDKEMERLKKMSEK